MTDEDREDFATAMGDTDESEPETPEAPPAEEDTPDEGDEEPSPEPAADENPVEEEPGPPSPATEEPTHPVVVDGQVVNVPLSELIKGYSRQSDYSRKMNALANQRRQLNDANELLLAMDRNPRETLAVLARHYGVEQPQPTSEGYDDEARGQTTGPTPEAERLRQLEDWVQSQESRQREAAVDTELSRLHNQYGEFDEEELFGFAVQRDIRDLETALRAMTYQPASAPRVEKRKVAGMAGGSGRNGAATPKQPVEDIKDFRDAYEAAKRELTRS